jgi:peptidoglycan/xylan/chitin deacetylase (PgdA/CDA1 family)
MGWSPSRVAGGLALAVGIVVGAFGVYGALLGAAADQPELAAAPPPSLPAPEGEPAPPVRALLLASPATAAYFAALPGANPQGYQSKLDHWTRRLTGAGHAVERIDETGIASAVADGRTVIVAPAAAALPDAAVAALEAAVARGVGLVATWQLALRTPDGGWRGWDALGRLTGATPLADAPAPETLRWVAIRGGTALGAGVPAGARLEIQPYDAPLPVAAAGAAADFVRWGLLPLDAPGGQPVLPAAAVEHGVGRGRVAWLNFDPDSLVPAGADAEWLERLIENALAWTAGRPLAELDRWPDGAQLAAMPSLDTEHQFQQGGRIAARFAAARVPITAFAVSSLAEQQPEVVRALAAAGEVGSHTSDHLPLAERSEAAQQETLEKSRDALRAITGERVVGLRPPEELIDAATFEAARAAGYEYLAGTGDRDRAEPWMVDVGGRAIVVVPRVPRDDYEYIVRTPVEDPAAVRAAVEDDLRQVRCLGGVFMFDFHTQYAADPRIVTAVGALLHRLHEPGTWLATGRDVARWWRWRARAAARVDPHADGTATLAVATGLPAPALGVAVYLPPGTTGAEATAEDGPAPAVVSVEGREGIVRVVWRDVPAGARWRARLRFAGR